MIKSIDATMHESMRELEILKKLNYEFKTDYGFLKTHYGYRPGKIHMAIGLTSAGKSTLVRGMIRDIYKNNSQLTRVDLWLSEESCSDFLLEIASLDISNEARRSIRIFSENEMPKRTTYDEIFEHIKSDPPAILFIDNITTSQYHMNSSHEKQGEFASDLKSMIEGDGISDGIACILIGHTSKTIKRTTTDLISIEDLRGHFGFGMIAQFSYVMQRFHIRDDIYNIISVQKKRGYSFANSEVYYLNYNQGLRVYDKDQNISREKLLEVLKIAKREKRES